MIVYIDRFGNLATNITEKELQDRDIAEIKVKGCRISGLSESYSDQTNDPLLAILASNGYLEIAAPNNSAKSILKAKKGDLVSVVCQKGK